MTKYEALNMVQSSLRQLIANRVDIRNVRHLDMYRDYERLTREGHKNLYIVHYLSEQYNISVPSIYRIVKTMREEMF